MSDTLAAALADIANVENASCAKGRAMSDRELYEPRGCSTPGACFVVERIAELEAELARVTEAAKKYITALDEYRRSDWQRDAFTAEEVCLALTAAERALRAALSDADAARKP